MWQRTSRTGWWVPMVGAEDSCALRLDTGGTPEPGCWAQPPHPALKGWKSPWSVLHILPSTSQAEGRNTRRMQWGRIPPQASSDKGAVCNQGPHDLLCGLSQITSMCAGSQRAHRELSPEQWGERRVSWGEAALCQPAHDGTTGPPLPSSSSSHWEEGKDTQ